MLVLYYFLNLRVFHKASNVDYHINKEVWVWIDKKGLDVIIVGQGGEILQSGHRSLKELKATYTCLREKPDK